MIALPILRLAQEMEASEIIRQLGMWAVAAMMGRAIVAGMGSFAQSGL